MAQPGFPRWAAAVLGLVALVAPLVAPNDYWIGVMARICLYATLALGLNIVVGFAGLLDLGYVAFFGIGSYLYTFLASAHFGLHLPFLLALPIVIVLTAFSGILIGAPTLRLAGDYLAIVTLGFGEITYLLLINLDRPVNITGGPDRKSTRLNSSHGYISYAVFCLKKKKKKTKHYKLKNRTQNIDGKVRNKRVPRTRIG